MTVTEAAIVEVLRQEFDEQDTETGYSQWVMAVSLTKEDVVYVYTARTVIKMNESPYVDGMDILFTVDGDKATIDPLFYEQSPDLLGSPEANALNWVKKLGDIIYLAIEEPRAEEVAADEYFD